MTNRSIFAITVGSAILMLVVIWFGWGARLLDCRDFGERNILVDNRAYRLAVADTPEEREQGLQGCHQVPERSGMLFVFENRQIPTFWMKGMVIPIDIVWVREGKVVGIKANLPPLTNQTDNPQVYSPSIPIDAVIELGANQAAELGIEIGATVQF